MQYGNPASSLCSSRTLQLTFDLFVFWCCRFFLQPTLFSFLALASDLKWFRYTTGSEVKS